MIDQKQTPQPEKRHESGTPHGSDQPTKRPFAFRTSTREQVTLTPHRNQVKSRFWRVTIFMVVIEIWSSCMSSQCKFEFSSWQYASALNFELRLKHVFIPEPKLNTKWRIQTQKQIRLTIQKRGNKRNGNQIDLIRNRRWEKKVTHPQKIVKYLWRWCKYINVNRASLFLWWLNAVRQEFRYFMWFVVTIE